MGYEEGMPTAREHPVEREGLSEADLRDTEILEIIIDAIDKGWLAPEIGSASPFQDVADSAAVILRALRSAGHIASRV